MHFFLDMVHFLCYLVSILNSMDKVSMCHGLRDARCSESNLFGFGSRIVAFAVSRLGESKEEGTY